MKILFHFPDPIIEISQMVDILLNERWNTVLRNDISQSLLFYERNYLYKVYPHTTPRLYEIYKLLDDLDVKATPGEFEPASFAIYSTIKRLTRRVKVKISSQGRGFQHSEKFSEGKR